MDNNFGTLPSTSTEDIKPPQGVHIKEELGKETPADNLKQVSCIEANSQAIPN